MKHRAPSGTRLLAWSLALAGAIVVATSIVAVEAQQVAYMRQDNPVALQSVQLKAVVRNDASVTTPAIYEHPGRLAYDTASRCLLLHVGDGGLQRVCPAGYGPDAGADTELWTDEGTYLRPTSNEDVYVVSTGPDVVLKDTDGVKGTQGSETPTGPTGRYWFWDSADAVVGSLGYESAGSPNMTLRNREATGFLDFATNDVRRMTIDHTGQTFWWGTVDANSYTGFKAPGTATNLVYTLPADLPAAGDAMTSAVDGTLTWTTIGGGGGGIGDAFLDDGNSFGEEANLGTNDAYDLVLRANGVDCLRVNQTVFPTSPLVQISRTDNNVFGTGSNGQGLASYNNGTGDNVFLWTVNNSAAGDPGISFLVQGTGGWIFGLDNSDGDKLKFSSTWNDLAGGARVTFQQDGNVGIGITAPASLLHVAGAAQLGTDSATTGSLKFWNAGSTKYVAFQAGVGVDSMTYTWPLGQPGANGYVLTSTTGGAMSWSNPAALSAGSVPFSGITSGTNSTATMVVSSGATLSPSLSGIIGANQLWLAGATNAMRWYVDNSGHLVPATDAAYDLGSTTVRIGAVRAGGVEARNAAGTNVVALEEATTRAGTTTADDFGLMANNTTSWKVLSTGGHMVPQTSNTYDVGESGGYVRSVYAVTLYAYNSGGTKTSYLDATSVGTHTNDDFSIYANSGVYWKFTTGKALAAFDTASLVDLTAISAGNTVLKVTVTNDAVTADPKTQAPKSWLEISDGTNARYIPLYSLDGT